jgi:hypothetical protein
LIGDIPLAYGARVRLVSRIALVETRHLIAYALIAALLAGGAIGSAIYARRRHARQRRLRGIKDYNAGRG